MSEKKSQPTPATKFVNLYMRSPDTVSVGSAHDSEFSAKSQSHVTANWLCTIRISTRVEVV